MGERHCDVARNARQKLESYKSLQDIVAVLDMDELCEEDKLAVVFCKGASLEAARTGTFIAYPPPRDYVWPCFLSW